jgi:hypothetical protein
MVMVPFHRGRGGSAFQVVLGLLVASVSSVSAQDEQQAEQRLEFMKAAVGSFEPESAELRPIAAFTLVPRPLLRCSDPTRGGGTASEAEANVLLDAGVWRLGTEGQPTALVTIEVYQHPDGSRLLSYESLSLSETTFTPRHKTRKIRWDPSGSALNLRELPNAAKPAGTVRERLVQMRQLAQRFAATERFNKESIECRLLTQPIDRYQSAAERIVDGAIFAYANSTNPELGLVFETDGERWLYGIIQLTAAESSVTLDGRQIAAFERYNSRGRTDGTYHSAAHRIEKGK